MVLTASTFAATGMYNATGNYNPYTTAPNTAHILWTKPEAFGGIIGGEFGSSETANYYATSQYEPKVCTNYHARHPLLHLYPGSAANPAGWAAVDLSTGQTLWTKNTTEVLRCGQILNMVVPNQYGALAYLWSQPLGSPVEYENLGASLGNSLEMWDAMTGNYILTISNTPSTSSGYGIPLTTDERGDLIGYYVNGTDNTLDMWNSTRCINLAVPNSYGGPPVADNWMWRPPQDAVIDFSLGIQWSAPLAATLSGSPLIDYANGLYGLGIYAIASGVVLMTEATAESVTALFYQPGWQIEAGYSAATGAQLWITNRTEPAFSIIGSIIGTSTWTGDGVEVEMALATLSASGYSVTTGKELWGPVTLPSANPFDSLGANDVIANGTIYIWLYGGDVYSINLATGAVNWHYHTPSGGYESPYGVEPLWTFNVGTVADGKLFVPEGHMYSPPLFHGAQQLALNITNGQIVWSIDAFDVTTAPAISDGIMTTLNAYDNQIYAYGMGPSKTTVTAPDIGVTTATPITITGTVMDISAGSSQEAVAANFPNGLPCVSDASMTQFMESVYMQQPVPHNVTGVPVTFSVIDSNGNYRTIGSTTTNGLGDYSASLGNQTYQATTQSTQCSQAHNHTMDPLPPQDSTLAHQQQQQHQQQRLLSGLASNTTVMYAVVAMIIVFIVGIAIVAVLVTRKHP